ncbi:MAG: pyrimidine dimer DNA glycosylase/endonuclease V [Candidatus Omnitrophota bacterium]
MRIWDIEPSKLCRNHLLGEHRELHAIWAILTKNKKGYSRHPETLRWKGKLKALYLRHEFLVKEFEKRAYQHKSDLQKRLASGSVKQNKFVNSYKEQIDIIKRKKCACKTSA